jgi:peptide/nickel transport system ATP-binding protein
MEMVSLPSTLLRRYPRELSGGERQRVCIARALACAPDLMVCDEITSALDVSVQAAVISLLQDLRSQLGLSMLFITHDMGVVANLADRVIVLDKGLICEVGPVEDVLHAAQSDYARTLIEAAPTMASA